MKPFFKLSPDERTSCAKKLKQVTGCDFKVKDEEGIEGGFYCDTDNVKINDVLSNLAGGTLPQLSFKVTSCGGPLKTFIVTGCEESWLNAKPVVEPVMGAAAGAGAGNARPEGAGPTDLGFFKSAALAEPKKENHTINLLISTNNNTFNALFDPNPTTARLANPKVAAPKTVVRGFNPLG